MGRLSENSVLNIKNKSFAVTADVEVPASGAEGVMIAQGGRFGGWSLYAKGGKAKFVYNVLGIKSYAIEATSAIPAGKTQVRMEFAYDGGGMGKGGNVTLYCGGKEVGKGRVEQTQGFIFSADETTDVGCETGTTVSPDYTAAHQQVQRPDQLGADRPGQGRRGRRPLHLAGGTRARRDGTAVDTRERANDCEDPVWQVRILSGRSYGEPCLRPPGDQLPTTATPPLVGTGARLNSSRPCLPTTVHPDAIPRADPNNTSLKKCRLSNMRDAATYPPMTNVGQAPRYRNDARGRRQTRRWQMRARKETRSRLRWDGTADRILHGDGQGLAHYDRTQQIEPDMCQLVDFCPPGLMTYRPST